MKRNFSKTAFTLLELIVSMTLVSIVILGITSVSMVLNGSGQDYGQKLLVKSETQATLNHILNNAYLAVGSGTADNYGNIDQGILWGAGHPPEITAGVPNGLNGVGDANSFCIHQAANANILQSPTAGYNTDIWLCYTWYPAAGANPYQIYWCTSTFTAAGAANSYRGASVPCAAASSTFLGTSFNNPVSFISFTPGGAFSMSLQNCLTDAATPLACNGGGTGISSDPVNNPEYSTSGSVIPPQQGNS